MYTGDEHHQVHGHIVVSSGDDKYNDDGGSGDDDENGDCWSTVGT